MGAMDPLFEIELDMAAKGSRESSRTLYGQLKAAILDGRLTAGAKLPPTRKSDAYFGISRNTAIQGFEKVLNESYILPPPRPPTPIPPQGFSPPSSPFP